MNLESSKIASKSVRIAAGDAMRVLVIAPHPFFQVRGSPIAVDLLLRCYLDLGMEVDLLTYDEGEDRHHPNLRIVRCRTFPRVSNIPPGFSGKKLWADIFLLVKYISLVRERAYDFVHAVEESSFFPVLTRTLIAIPYVYDMDSSLVTQLLNRFPVLEYIKPFLRKIEAVPIRGSVAVAAVCDDLADLAKHQKTEGIFLLQDISLLDAFLQKEPEEPIFRRVDSTIVVTYVGNLESYQGVYMLIQAFSLAYRDQSNLRLVIAGGSDEKIAQYRRFARSLGLCDEANFVGEVHPSYLGSLFARSDILVSPRLEGENTPMKIYTYLHSGRAILATALPTHTQILDDEIALLVPATAIDLAGGIRKLASDTALRATLGRNARERANERHRFESFTQTCAKLVDYLEKKLRC